MRTLSFGIVDGQAVFMDERTDTYFKLHPSEKHVHRLLDGARPRSSNPDLLDLLDIREEPAEVVRATYPSASKSLLDRGELPGPSAAHVIKAANLVWTTASRLRRQPIEAVLRDVLATRGPEAAGALHHKDMIVQASRFLGARRLVPFKHNCLLDSLSLLRWLGDRKSAAAFLFGIKLDPFAAHCWVQAGDLILNDRAENVAAFTPIRVIRCSEAMQ